MVKRTEITIRSPAHEKTFTTDTKAMTWNNISKCKWIVYFRMTNRQKEKYPFYIRVSSMYIISPKMKLIDRFYSVATI